MYIKPCLILKSGTVGTVTNPYTYTHMHIWIIYKVLMSNVKLLTLIELQVKFE